MAVKAGINGEAEIIQAWISNCRILFENPLFHCMILVNQSFLVEDVDGVNEGINACSSGQQKDLSWFLFLKSQSESFRTCNADRSIKLGWDEISCKVSVVIFLKKKREEFIFTQLKILDLFLQLHWTLTLIHFISLQNFNSQVFLHLFWNSGH